MSETNQETPAGPNPDPRPGSGAGRSGKTVPIARGSDLQRELSDLLRNSLRPVLVVLSGMHLGRRIELSGTSEIGRDPEADVVLEDPEISWRHARIEDRGDSWAIVDLDSMNGTRLRGEAVRERVLENGDALLVGETLLRVELRSAVERKLDKQLQRVLDTDDLTGLMVRRKFDEALQALIRRAEARGERVGMLVMDMDGIKAINDTNGHLFGAHVIAETGRLIGEVVGERGIATRFGGDEFIAALEASDREATEAVAHEIHEAVNAHEYVRDGIELHPGISIGVAACPDDAEDAVSLFEHADAAMYRAKNGGRNRVSL